MQIREVVRFCEPKGQADTWSSSDNDDQDVPQAVEHDSDAELWHTLGTGLRSPLDHPPEHASIACDQFSIPDNAAPPQFAPASGSVRGATSQAPADPGASRVPRAWTSATALAATAALSAQVKRQPAFPRIPHYSPTGTAPITIPLQQTAGAAVVPSSQGAVTSSWPPRVVPGAVQPRVQGCMAAPDRSIQATTSAGINWAPRRGLKAGQQKPGFKAVTSKGNNTALPRPQQPQQQSCTPSSVTQGVNGSTPRHVSDQAAVVVDRATPSPPQHHAMHVSSCPQVHTAPSMGFSALPGVQAGIGTTVGPQQSVPVGTLRSLSRGVNGGIFGSPQRTTAPGSSGCFFIPGPQIPVVLELPPTESVVYATQACATKVQPTENIFVQQADANVPRAESVFAAQQPDANVQPADKSFAAPQAGANVKLAEHTFAVQQADANIPPGPQLPVAAEPPCPDNSFASNRACTANVQPTEIFVVAQQADANVPRPESIYAAMQPDAHVQPAEHCFAALQAGANVKPTDVPRPESFVSALTKNHVAGQNEVENSVAHDSAAVKENQHDLKSPPLEPLHTRAKAHPGSLRSITEMAALGALQRLNPQTAPAINPPRQGNNNTPGAVIRRYENVATGVNVGAKGKNQRGSGSTRRRASGSDRVLRVDGVERAWNLNEEDTDDSGDESGAMSLSEASGEESESDTSDSCDS